MNGKGSVPERQLPADALPHDGNAAASRVHHWLETKVDRSGVSTVVYADANDWLAEFAAEVPSGPSRQPTPLDEVPVHDSEPAELAGPADRTVPIEPTVPIECLPCTPVHVPSLPTPSPSQPIASKRGDPHRHTLRQTRRLDRFRRWGMIAAALVLSAIMGYTGVRRYAAQQHLVLTPRDADLRPSPMAAIPSLTVPASSSSLPPGLAPLDHGESPRAHAVPESPHDVPAPARDSEARVPESRGTDGESPVGTSREPTRTAGGREPASLNVGAFSSAVFLPDRWETADTRDDADPTRQGLRIVTVAESGATSHHPRLSPEGRLVAFDSDRDGERGVYLANRDGTNVRRISGAGYAAMPSWSPDGEQLAFLRAEPGRPTVWNVWIRTLATDALTRVTSYRAGQPSAPAWLPDGHRVCYGYENRLQILDTRTLDSSGSVVPLVTYLSPRKGRAVDGPAAAPDGRRIVFTVGGDGVWILDLHTREMRRVVEDPSVDDLVWDKEGRRLAYHTRRDDQWRVWFAARPS